MNSQNDEEMVYVFIASQKNKNVLEERLSQKLSQNSKVGPLFRQNGLKVVQNSNKDSDSISFQGYAFTFEIVDGIIYLCCTTTTSEIEKRSTIDRRRAFLSDLREQYLSLHLPTGAFSRAIAQLMEKYNTGLLIEPENDKVGEIRKQVDGVKGIMMQNFDKILERGEKIEDVLDQSEQLMVNSNRFRDSSSILRKRLWWKNVRIVLAIVCVFLIILMIILFSACGWGFERCK